MEGSIGARDLERSMQSRGLPQPGTRMSLVIRNGTCRRYRRTGKADRERGFMAMRTALQVPGCEGWHAAHGSHHRPGGLAGSQVAPGNGSVEGGADIAAGPARIPPGSSYRGYRPGNLARGQEPSGRHGDSQAWRRSDGLTARNGPAKVR